MKYLVALVLTVAACVANAAPYNRVLPLLDKDSDAVATAILLSKTSVLTAAHAVSTATQSFACGNSVVKGRLVKMDLKHDLAAFMLEAPCEKVDVTPLAPLAAAEGEPITVQGYPGTNQRRTVVGVVADYEVLSYPPATRLYMIMDIVISGGNSGGPVLDAKGALVGVVQGKLCYKMGEEVPATCYGAAIPLVVIKTFLDGVLQ